MESVPPGVLVEGVRTGVETGDVGVTVETYCTLFGNESATMRFVTVWPGATVTRIV
jgi:hypothetical protein